MRKSLTLGRSSMELWACHCLTLRAPLPLLGFSKQWHGRDGQPSPGSHPSPGLQDGQVGSGDGTEPPGQKWAGLTFNCFVADIQHSNGYIFCRIYPRPSFNNPIGFFGNWTRREGTEILSLNFISRLVYPRIMISILEIWMWIWIFLKGFHFIIASS